MKTHLTLAALAACALGGLSAVNAADPVETDAASSIAPASTYASDLPRFQPEVEFTATPVVQSVPEVVEAVEEDADEIGGGEASWYGAQFAGRRTASGERFNPAQYTAAHRTLPFGSKVRVTHARSGKSVVVRINDRGPFAHDRVIDLSRAAAQDLGIVGAGRGKVELALVS